MVFLEKLLDNNEFQSFENDLKKEIGISETPVDLKTFLYHEDYLGLKIRLSPKQFSVLEAADNLDSECQYNEFIIQVGKGGGKDLITILVFARISYRLLCVADLPGRFGLQSFDTIDLLNIAVSADQAKDVFFIRFKNVIKNAGPKAYKQFGFNPTKDISQTKIIFPKNIIAYSGHSRQESQEGKNYFLVVFDECSGFLIHKAQALYDVMRSSINTRFPRIGKLFLISYPRYKNDFIQRKYNEAARYTNIYRTFGATWEFNPTKKKSDFVDDYRKNPDKARAMFECKPEVSGEAYIKDLDKIASIFNNELKDPTDEFGRFREWFRGDPYMPERYYVHVDLALGKVDDAGFRKGDVAAVAMGYKGENDIIYIVYQKVYEGAPGKEVEFTRIKEDILDLKNKRGMQIVRCSTDGWQSVQFGQELRAAGIPTVLLSVDRTLEPYDTLKAAILQEKIKAYPLRGKLLNYPTSNLLEEELKNLELLVTGSGKGQIDHTDVSSKDLSDSICAVVYSCLKSEPMQTSGFVWRSVKA